MPPRRVLPHIAGAHSGYAIDKYKVEHLPLTAYGGYYAIALTTEAAAAEPVIGALYISAGTGAPYPTEVTDSGIVGLYVNDTADSVGILYPIPYDMDVKSPMDFAIMWTSNTSTSTETVTWKVLYTELTMNSEAIEAGASALDTVIAADAQAGTAQAIQQTAWGTLNGGTLTHGNVLALDVSYSAESGIDAASDKVHGLYLVVRYIRRIL